MSDDDDDDDINDDNDMMMEGRCSVLLMMMMMIRIFTSLSTSCYINRAFRAIYDGDGDMLYMVLVVFGDDDGDDVVGDVLCCDDDGVVLMVIVLMMVLCVVHMGELFLTARTIMGDAHIIASFGYVFNAASLLYGENVIFILLNAFSLDSKTA